jgi:DNA-directed RNA polymerase subunit RPC12/RpoP
MNWFTLIEELKLPIIECPKCKMRFLLMGLTRLEYGDQLQTQYMGPVDGPNKTGNSGYCPYCGGKIGGKADK